MMNLYLSERISGNNFPQELDGVLELPQGIPNCCKFNRWGTYVAVGGNDGRVYICDIVTKGVVRSWTCHQNPIISLSWTRSGRKLATTAAAKEWSVATWDVLHGGKIDRFVYSSPVVSAIFNPRDENQLLIVYLSGNPMIEDIRQKVKKEIKVTGVSDEQFGDVTVATFDRRGKYVVTGTSKGRIAFFDARTTRLITYIRQNATHQIRNIVFSRRSDFVITNSADRIIRAYNLNDMLKKQFATHIEPVYKVSDIVNKTSWKAVCTSCCGDYVCGASKSNTLFVWKLSNGALKQLEGPKGETLLDVQWHPSRPIITSLSNVSVSVWTQCHVENWSAFAPEFVELEENTKYVEKESEFDFEDEDADVSLSQNAKVCIFFQGADETIDVVTPAKNVIYYSSDEEDDCVYVYEDAEKDDRPLWFIPVSPDSDTGDENALNTANSEFFSFYQWSSVVRLETEIQQGHILRVSNSHQVAEELRIQARG
uniref:WD_REPEATS_REGION domain-containing protein n=1 Tax=Syphacia muris TaxID=451379 RepID=A0A158R4D0_9BILA